MVFSSGILTVFLLLCSTAIVATEQSNRRNVVLQGVLGSKAVLSIDGSRVLLSSGQMKDGVKLLNVLPNSATVLIDGKQKKLRLGDSSVVASPYKERKSVTVTVVPDNRGMYTTTGSINGLPVSFLVDTGATTIAMNSGQAKRLGVDYRIKGEPTMVGTASGMTRAYRVTLDKVSVGSITLNYVTAVVIDGNFPVQILLGMSFLGQLDIQREGNIMRMRQKY